jgi:ABC-type hemin transport system substrate-binding protein
VAPRSNSRVTDGVGRQIAPLRTGGRLVSLVPSITELLCDLGAAEQLVGVSRFCTHPPEVVAAVEKVGGTKDPDCDRIAELRPDLVFVDRDENRRDDFDRLEAARLATFVAHPHTVRDAARMVAAIGRLVGHPDEGVAVAAAIDAELANSGPTDSTPVRVFCPIWRNPWMSFNETTYAADLLRQAGGATICRSATPYPLTKLSEVAAQFPEVILLPDEPYVFGAKHIPLMTELSQTPAWESGRVHLIDGKAMFWYGARTPAALRQLRTLLQSDGC